MKNKFDEKINFQRNYPRTTQRHGFALTASTTTGIPSSPDAVISFLLPNVLSTACHTYSESHVFSFHRVFRLLFLTFDFHEVQLILFQHPLSTYSSLHQSPNFFYNYYFIPKFTPKKIPNLISVSKIFDFRLLSYSY